MPKTKAQPNFALAKELVEELHAFGLRESPSRDEELAMIGFLKQLAEQGLIRRLGTTKVDCYFLRNGVHGSPMLQGPPGHTEVIFKSLDFARACRDAYHLRAGRPSLQILKVIEE